MIKRIIPRSLLGRSLLIVVVPLVLLQVISALIFFESHWDKVSLRLARGLSGDISAVIRLMRRNPAAADRAWIFVLAEENLDIKASFDEGAVLSVGATEGGDLMERTLIRALKERMALPIRIDSRPSDRAVVVDVQLASGVLRIVTPRKRLFSSTTYVFVLWMVGTSLLLFGVATIFMRNQVKPIRRLAQAAEEIGKGRDVPSFKPEGASEVRQAASAFLAMRERILRQRKHRTEMLAGVSHDLRTPLTRMKLQLELLGGSEATGDLQEDVAEMEHMLAGYLAFARGEGTERPVATNVGRLLGGVVAQARRNGSAIELETADDITLPLRPVAFKRCLANLVDNAVRYADHVSITAGVHRGLVNIVIDDDGPGIPSDKREDVFQAFIRLENSRNPETGGVGLGLTIARDVVRGHGGDIALDQSPAGGLRAMVTLPV